MSKARFPCPHCGHSITDQDAAGFSIVHKDEIHAPSVERAIAANEKAREAAIYSGQIDFVSGVRVGHDRAAAALRELMKEVDRG